MKDSLLTQLLFFSALLDYHQHFGPSRGSFLAIRNEMNTKFAEKLINLPGNLTKFNFITSNFDLSSQIQTISYINNRINIPVNFLISMISSHKQSPSYFFKAEASIFLIHVSSIYEDECFIIGSTLRFRANII